MEYKEIMETLVSKGFEAYLVGGCVRDKLLGEDPHDYDIFTNATGDEILNIFPQGNVIGNEDRQQKILTVMVDGIEVSQYRADSKRLITGNDLMSHLSTCDFTINSIAEDVNGVIVDPNNGQKDLKTGLLRCVGVARDRINEDPLRLLRAIRFAGKLDLKIDSELSKELSTSNLKGISLERVKEELMKMIEYGRSVELLLSYRLLDEIIPEITQLRNLDGGSYHNETVLEHMVFSLQESAELTDNPLLLFACFVHDIGKIEHQYTDGELTFYGHDGESERLAKEIMERLKFSNDEIDYVSTLIKYHMADFWTSVTKRTYANLFAALEKAKIPIEDFVVILYADYMGNLKHERVGFEDFLKENKFYRKYVEFKMIGEPFKVSDLKINGNDVMDSGVKKGISVGMVLREIFNKVMNGELKNERPELMFYLKNRSVTNA
jgi:tRNA nucleotidyltransferase/poly(A) polymerase